MDNVYDLRNSGSIPIADFRIFDSIEMLNVSDFVMDNENFILSMYKKYMNQINSMENKDIISFLKVIKNMEIINNHSLEQDDSFLTALYLERIGENSIDYLLSNINMSKEIFTKGHKLLLKGTKSQKYFDKEYRTDNKSCVGNILPDGSRKINYFAINYEDIDEAIERLLNFYNSDIFDEHMFLKSQIIHGIVASLQMFDDGNTRYARILQNIKLYSLTKKYLDSSLINPILYGTKSYFPYRGKYRELIMGLVVSPNQDSWDNWFEFNLNRCEDQMYFLSNKIEQYKRLIK